MGNSASTNKCQYKEEQKKEVHNISEYSKY